MTSVIDQAAWRSRVRRALLRWFDRHARTLPWRTDPTPYHVWISEVMLQQTQVATVVDYYNRFETKFPTIVDLANADESELMRLWEGLGYYRRARLMHQAAKTIVDRHAGEFPTDFASVLDLPGIGRYTAGAILSISGDARLPILEGNTVRVFSRWAAMREDVKSKSGNDQLWKIAAAMLPRTGSGRFNQAAMELGALVCKPAAPLCDRCPVSKWCEAYRQGLQNVIPGKVTSMIYENRREFAFVIPAKDRDAWLIYQIPGGQRWAGLWDFPRATEGHFQMASDALNMVSRRIGMDLQLSHQLTAMKHAVTRYRILLEVHQTEPIDDGKLLSQPENYRFVTKTELESHPLSVTGRRITKILVDLP